MEVLVSLRRGGALVRVGRVGEAVEEYKRTLKVDEGNQEAEKALERLSRL